MQERELQFEQQIDKIISEVRKRDDEIAKLKLKLKLNSSRKMEQRKKVSVRSPSHQVSTSRKQKTDKNDLNVRFDNSPTIIYISDQENTSEQDLEADDKDQEGWSSLDDSEQDSDDLYSHYDFSFIDTLE